MNEPPKKKPFVKWILLGCGGVGLLLLLLMTGIFFLVMALIKNSDSYVLSKHFIETNRIVREKLGAVTGLGYFPQGSQNTSNGRGNASWSVSVQGSNDKGIVVTYLSKNPGRDWVLDEAYIQLHDQEWRLDQPGAPGPIRHFPNGYSSDWDD